MNYVLIGLIALVLLGGLVAFGMGHRRWSWGTIVAAFLVLLSATGYLYVATRMAAYEWSWTSFVRSKQVQLARQQDALVPDEGSGGRLVPAPDAKPLTKLSQDRDRWQRALQRIETWHGRFWEKATFQPPKDDAATGTLDLPAPAPAGADGAGGEPPVAAEGEGEAAEGEGPQGPKPPIDPGATIYVFERVEDGIGTYLGSFLVRSSAYDAGSRRFNLTVSQTAPRDAYDAEAWSRDYDDVVVFENLPVDRWLAFSRIGKNLGEGADAPLMPEPRKLSIDQVEAMLDDRDRQKQFIEEVKEHESATAAKDEWPDIRRRLESGESLPGEYWAVVKFKEPHAVAEDLADEIARRTFEVDEEAEFDLQTAFELADGGQAEIVSVRYRRPLRDAGTLIHGSRIFPGRTAKDDPLQVAMTASGIVALLETLRQDIADLDASNQRLTEADQSLSKELADARGRQERLAEDMKSWTRDAKAAERTADAFEAEHAAARSRLEAALKAIVDKGAKLREAVKRLVVRIDEEAPPAARPIDAAAGR